MRCVYVMINSEEDYLRLASTVSLTNEWDTYKISYIKDYPIVQLRFCSLANRYRYNTSWKRHSKRAKEVEVISIEEFISSLDASKQNKHKEKVMTYMVCAVKKATVREQEDGKGDVLVGELKAVCATSEAGAIAQYTRDELSKVEDLSGVDVQVKNF